MKPYAISESGFAGARFSGDANWETTWRLCEYAQRIEYGIDWVLAGGPAPAGSFELDGNTSVGQAGLTPAAAQTHVIPAPLGTPGTYGDWPTIIATPGRAAIIVVNPMRWHRLRFVHAGGGAIGQFEVTCTITPR